MIRRTIVDVIGWHIWNIKSINARSESIFQISLYIRIHIFARVKNKYDSIQLDCSTWEGSILRIEIYIVFLLSVIAFEFSQFFVLKICSSKIHMKTEQNPLFILIMYPQHIKCLLQLIQWKSLLWLKKERIKKLIEVHVCIVCMKMSARAFIVKRFSDIRGKIPRK